MCFIFDNDKSFFSAATDMLRCCAEHPYTVQHFRRNAQSSFPPEQNDSSGFFAPPAHLKWTTHKNATA